MSLNPAKKPIPSAQKEIISQTDYYFVILTDCLQLNLVISKSKGPSETLRDIRTSTYQICRIEENSSETTKFHEWTCNLTPLVEIYMYIENIVEKGRNLVTWY